MKKYPKVKHPLGSNAKYIQWERFESGAQIVLEEKIDGSNFRIGINKDGTVQFGSRTQDETDDSFSKKTFRPIIDYVTKHMDSWNVREKMMNTLESMEYDSIIIFGEYLSKPRHSTLYYERIPKNYLAVFDIAAIRDGTFTMLHPECELFDSIVKLMDFDKVPILFSGKSECAMQDLFTWAREEHKVESYLGGQMREGVIFKNYEPYHDGEFWQSLGEETILPMVKFVREEFKEALSGVANKDKTKKGSADIDEIVQYIMESYITKGRVQKSIMKLEEQHGRGKIDRQYTGSVIGDVFQDILAEQKEEIDKLLHRAFNKRMNKHAGLIRELFFQILEENLLSS